MGHPTCLLDPDLIVVADTSALINLNATGRAPEILRALPNRIIVAEAVLAELEQGRARGRENARLTEALVSQGLLAIGALGTRGLHWFEQLVVGAAVDTLDDGEAASIALALETGGAAILDERKARRICAERYAALVTGCSTDLFGHRKVQDCLGRDGLVEALLKALEIARMSVPQHHVEWIIGLIGKENAAKCPSLPRAARDP